MVINRIKAIESIEKGEKEASIIFNSKIEEQKNLFDKKIEQLERNAIKKEILIEKLKNAINKLSEENNINSTTYDLIKIFQACIYAFDTDIKATQNVSANTIIEESQKLLNDSN